MKETDPISNVILSRLNNPLIPADESGLEVFQESKRHIKFKFSPCASDNGYVFITTEPTPKAKVAPFADDFRLEAIGVPKSLSNVNADYIQYLKELHEIYQGLDTYKYPLSLYEIGLINSNITARKTQDRLLYGALDSIITSLGLVINKKVDSVDMRKEAESSEEDSEEEEKDDDDEDEDDDDERNEIYGLKDLWCVLNFLKATYFSSDLIFAKNFSTWINKSDSENPSRELLDQVLDLENPYNSDIFFTYVNQLIIRGLFDQSLNILLSCKYQELKETNDFTFYLFESLIKLLNEYHIIHNAGNSSINVGEEIVEYIDEPILQDKINVLFKDFKKNALECIDTINEYLLSCDNGDFSINLDDRALILRLRKTFLLLSGSKSVILGLSSSWFEALNGLLLFDLPNRKLLPDHLETVLSSRNHSFEVDYTNIWETLCYSLLKNNNLLLVLKSLEQFSSDTTAFLSVLLDAKGFLKDYNRIDYLQSKGEQLGGIGDTVFDLELHDDHDVDEYVSEISDLSITQFLLYNFAVNCFSNKKVIDIGVSILKSLNLRNFKQILTDYLPYNYYCEKKDDYEWLMNLCAENKLIYLSNNLNKLFGLQLYQSGDVLQSLETLIKTGDYRIVSKIIWEVVDQKLIEKYNFDESTDSSSIIDLFDYQDDDIDINAVAELSNDQKSFLMAYKLDPVLKRFLSPYILLVKYMKYERSNKFNVSKSLLVDLVNFNYLPTKTLSILLLLLLKYFNLNFTNMSSNVGIGLSLFETSELMEIIQTLNKFLKETERKSELRKADTYYEEYVKLVHTNLNHEYTEFGIEIPENISELLKILRNRISLEISRKYLE